MTTPRVAFLGANDWANMCHRYCAALRKRGWEAWALITAKHPFEYEEADAAPPGGWHEMVRSADFVLPSGDGNYAEFDRIVAEYGPLKKGVVKVGLHAGSHYREHYSGCDASDRNRGFFRRVFAADLFRMVPDEDKAGFLTALIPPPYIVPAIPITTGPLRVLHAPSNPVRKGTIIVDAVMKRFPDARYTKVVGRPNADVLAAMRDADLFIDTLYDYEGNIGGAVAEAAAHGLAVVTDFHNVAPETAAQIGDLPFFEVRGEAELEKALKMLLNDRIELRLWKRRALSWAQRYLSPEGTERIWRRNLGLE